MLPAGFILLNYYNSFLINTANVSVKNACFSKVQPTPLSGPSTVAYSSSAMRLLDLPESELQRPEFPGFVLLFILYSIISSYDSEPRSLALTYDTIMYVISYNN